MKPQSFNQFKYVLEFKNILQKGPYTNSNGKLLKIGKRGKQKNKKITLEK